MEHLNREGWTSQQGEAARDEDLMCLGGEHNPNHGSSLVVYPNISGHPSAVGSLVGGTPPSVTAVEALRGNRCHPVTPNIRYNPPALQLMPIFPALPSFSQAGQTFGIARAPVRAWPASSVSTSVVAQSASQSASGPLVCHVASQVMLQATVHQVTVPLSAGSLPIASPFPVCTSAQTSTTTSANHNFMVPLKFDFVAREQAPVYELASQTSEVPSGGAVLESVGAGESLSPLRGRPDAVPATCASESALSTRLPVAHASQPNLKLVQNANPTARAKHALQVALSKWTDGTSSSTSKAASGRQRRKSGSVAEPAKLMCYECECGFRCTSETLLGQHMVTFHVIPFANICKLCGIKSPSLKAQKQHVVQHMTVAPIDKVLNSRVPLLGRQTSGCRPARGDSPLVSSTVHLDSDDDSGVASEHLTSDDDPDLSFMNLRRDLVGSVALKPFFKCVLGDCKFTSNIQQAFFNHLAAHTVRELSSLMCIYCGQKFEAIAALLQHMVTGHGQRCYQCGWCLYRSTFPIHLQVHLHHFHPEKGGLIFKCPNIAAESPSKCFASQCVTLTHYWCSVPSCSYKHRNPDVFEWHLTAEHPGTQQYQCKMCDATISGAKALIQHCVEHNMDAVQCVYCHHSEPSYREMLWHLSTYHQDHRLKLFIRTEAQRIVFKEFIARFQEMKFRGMIPEVRQPPKTVRVARPTVQEVTKSCKGIKLVSAGESSRSRDTTMALHCAECSKKFTSLSQLRSHLYSHKEYFPHFCKMCNECFTTLEEARSHEETRHKASGGNPQVEEFRLLPVEAQVDACIEKQLERLEARVEDLDTVVCPWWGCGHLSADMECTVRHMRTLHVPTRQMCALCLFSSYSRDVVRWHSKEAHKPPRSQPANVAPATKKAAAGDRKCGLCSFRAGTSGAVREHWSKTHPGLAVRIVVPPRHGQASRAATAKKCIMPLLSLDPCTSAEPSPPAVTSPPVETPPPADTSPHIDEERESWQERRPGLPCLQCEHVAPSEHMLHMHKLLRHVVQPSTAKVKDITKLLMKGLEGRVPSACSKEENRACQLTGENPNALQNADGMKEEQVTTSTGEQNEGSSPRSKRPAMRALLKNEPHSEVDATDIGEDPEPAPPKEKGAGAELTVCTRLRSKSDPEQQWLLGGKDEAREQQTPSCKENVEEEHTPDHNDHACTRKNCHETFATESELHSHMSDKHDFFAVCPYRKQGCMSRRRVLNHLDKAHPGYEADYTVIRHKKWPMKRKPVSTDSSAEFSWYNLPREPICTKNMWIVTRLPDSTGYVKLDVDIFFKLCDANPSVVVKDYLRNLA